MATALVAFPYLADKTVALGKESFTAATRAKGADAALDRALEELVAMRGGPPGVIAVVQRGKYLRAHRFGVADLSKGRRPRLKDHMRIASVSKAFSGATALSLVSKGVLALDDTIGERLPSLPEAWAKVTLRQLLNHTSGIPDFTQSQRFQRVVRANPTTPPRPRELLSFVENKPLSFTPGTRYEYSNSDNIAVGLMIQAATNSSYKSQLKKRVYAVLGLGETSLPVGPQLPEPFTTATTMTPRSSHRRTSARTSVQAGLGPPEALCLRPPTSTASSAATLAAGSSAPKPGPSSAGSSREEAPIRPVRERTRPGSGSSATRRAAGRYGATQGA
jgi:CubicO group peptidase (beta-lactamase class C family)